MQPNKFFLVFVIVVITWTSAINAQSCNSSDYQLDLPLFYSNEIAPKHQGEIFRFNIQYTNTTTIRNDGAFAQYFEVELDIPNEELIVSTTANFLTYEKEQNEIEPGFSINLECFTGTDRILQIMLKIERQNNYAPEFSRLSYEIDIPTPLPRGFDVTYFLIDAQLSAIDYDLFNNSITFEIEGTDLFQIDVDVDRNGLKPIYTAKLLAKQIIFQVAEVGLSFTLRATDTFDDAPRSSEISIVIHQDSLNSYEEPGHFAMTIYNGIFHEINNQLEIPLITLNPQYYTENTIFLLTGSSHFQISSSDVNGVQLEAIPSSTEAIMSESFHLFSVDAFEHDVKIASTNVLIETRASAIPAFEKNFYTAILTGDRSLLLDDIKVSGNNLAVSLNSSLFSSSITDNIVTVTFDGALIPVDNFVIIVMTLTDTETSKQSESILVVNVDVNFEDTLEFSAPLYEGEISKSLQLTHVEVSLNHDTFDIEIGGRDLQFFTASQSGQTINLVLQNVDQIPKNVSYLHITLIATSSVFQGATATVIVGIERDNSIDVDNENDQPYFESEYFIRILSSEIGEIGTILAKVTDESALRYSLQFDDGSLASKISVDNNGVLTLLENIEPGVYIITAIAENVESLKQASTKITINVIQKVCDTELLTTVEKTLAIQHLAENEIYNEIMNSKINDCEYEIISVAPSSLGSIFAIDTTSHFLRNTQAFDRESLIFRDQIKPQIQIVLELNCNSSSSLMAMSNVITDEIIFSTKTTHLNIIIEDVNDNSPVINNPSTSSYKIGFPEESLIERLMPPQLIKVDAYDLDEGINAKIKFFVTPSTHFDIDPESGIIYPKQKLIESSTIITTRAVDLDGDENGNSAQVVLEVIKLTIDEIIQMTVNNLTLTGVDDFMENFSSLVDIDLRIISHAPIPNDHVSTARQLSDLNDGKMILYVYAFASNGDVLKAQALIDILMAVNSPELAFSLISSNDGGSSNNHNEKSSTGAWVAAVSVLASLLLLIIIAIPIVYFVWLRKDNPTNFDTSSSRDLNDNFDTEPGQSTPITNRENIENAESQATAVTVESDDGDDIVGVEVDRVQEETTVATLSDAEILNNRLLSMLEDGGSDDKKIVSFKNFVERIEVLEDEIK